MTDKGVLCGCRILQCWINYFADFGWTGVRRVSAEGILSTIVGSNLPLAATAAAGRLSGPVRIARLNQPRMVLPDFNAVNTLAILEK